MKKILLILLLVGSLLLGISIATAQIGDSSAFEDINKPTEENTQYIKTAYADDVFKKLDENLAFFNSLYNKVKATTDIDSLKDDLENGFSKLASSFKEIVENKSEIEKNLKSRLTIMVEYGMRSETVKDSIETEIGVLNKEKGDAEAKLKEASTNSLEAKKLQMRIGTIDSRITALRTRKNVWENYVNTHNELRGNLGDLVENISLFLYALEQTAEVYEEAYETIKIVSKAAQAIDSLKALADIDAYSESLLNTFNQVDEIMLKLNSIDFEAEIKTDEEGEPISFLSIPFLLLPIGCSENASNKKLTPWHDAMLKYQDLVKARDNVIKLMQEKSQTSLRQG